MEFGFDPEVKKDIDPTKLTDIPDVQNYFTGNHKKTQSVAYRKVKKLIKGRINKDPRILNTFGKLKGWSHLYLPPKATAKVNDPDNKMLTLLYIYTANKAVEFYKLRNKKMMEREELVKVDLWKLGRKKFRVSGKRGREGIEYSEANSDTFGQIENITAFSAYPESQLFRTVSTVFERLDGKGGNSFEESLVCGEVEVEEKEKVSKEKKRNGTSDNETNNANPSPQKKIKVNGRKKDEDDTNSNTQNNTTVGTVTTALSQTASTYIDCVKEALGENESMSDGIVQVIKAIDAGGEDGLYGELNKILFKNSGAKNVDSSEGNTHVDTTLGDDDDGANYESE